MDSNQLRDIARQAMLQRNLEPDFSDAAQDEANALSAPTFGSAAAAPALRDLRALPWCSIDNDDSRDLDQLSVTQPGAGGAVRVLVAIADVDALVHPGSAIDAHARINTTSVYTAAGVFPMLPLRLSTDLSSLNQDEDRAALVIEFSVNADGSSC